MGLLVHVFETQALTKPIECAYTAEVQCLLKCTALDEDGGPLECQRSYFGYCAFSYFHFDVRSDWVSIVVGLGVSLHIVGGYLPSVEIALSTGRQNYWGVPARSLLKSHSYTCLYADGLGYASG